MRRRFPVAVYRHGTEPDPRFSLANERTFLAWIRTSLALLAAGVALLALDLPLQGGLQLAAAGIFALAALGAAIWAWFSWATAERALRLGSALPGLGVGGGLAALLVVALVLLLIGALLGDLGQVR
jgi:inner membrane protein YidH